MLEVMGEAHEINARFLQAKRVAVLARNRDRAPDGAVILMAVDALCDEFSAVDLQSAGPRKSYSTDTDGGHHLVGRARVVEHLRADRIQVGCRRAPQLWICHNKVLRKGVACSRGNALGGRCGLRDGPACVKNGGGEDAGAGCGGFIDDLGLYLRGRGGGGGRGIGHEHAAPGGSVRVDRIGYVQRVGHVQVDISV